MISRCKLEMVGWGHSLICDSIVKGTIEANDNTSTEVLPDSSSAECRCNGSTYSKNQCTAEASFYPVPDTHKL